MQILHFLGERFGSFGGRNDLNGSNDLGLRKFRNQRRSASWICICRTNLRSSLGKTFIYSDNRLVSCDMVANCKEAEHSIPKEALKLLQSLAAGWEDIDDEKELKVVRLKGALTNEVYQCHWLTKNGASRRMVLVRIYGEGVDVFFNRKDEICTFECMSRHGQGPRLLGRFHNGRIEEFIHARTLSAADLRDPEISAIIAAKLREFHDLDMPGPKDPFLWNRLRNWLIVATKLCSTEEAAEFELSKIGEEINILEKEVSNDDQKIGFCHNDLQYGNIMMDEETKALTIIDYEYATFNPVAYDIANHFCEMAADYHTETPQLLDFNKYPVT